MTAARTPAANAARPEDGQPDARPQVVYVWQYREWGGAQTYLLGQIPRVRHHYDVRVLIPDGSTPILLHDLARRGIAHETFGPAVASAPAAGLRARLLDRAGRRRSALALERYVRETTPPGSILHCDIGPWHAFPLLLHFLRRYRVVVTLHTAVLKPSPARAASWRFKLARLFRHPGFALIAANKDVRDSLAPYVSPPILSRIPIAYSFVDRDEIQQARQVRLSRADLAQRLDLPADRFWVVTLGQFIERKGCRELLAAAARLDPAQYQFLWIATEPPHTAQAALIDAARLGRRFHVVTHGDLGGDRATLLAALATADAFALPSLQEGLPLALIEAMAVGLPCISTRINAIPEAIDSGVSGLLIPPGSVDALVEALETLRRDPDLRARLAAEGRRRADTQFELTTTAGATLKVYEGLSRDAVR